MPVNGLTQYSYSDIDIKNLIYPFLDYKTSIIFNPFFIAGASTKDDSLDLIRKGWVIDRHYWCPLISSSFQLPQTQLEWCHVMNSSVPSSCGNNYRSVIFKLISGIDIVINSCEIALRWTPPIDDKLTFGAAKSQWVRKDARYLFSIFHTGWNHSYVTWYNV